MPEHIKINLRNQFAEVEFGDKIITVNIDTNYWMPRSEIDSKFISAEHHANQIHVLMRTNADLAEEVGRLKRQSALLDEENLRLAEKCNTLGGELAKMERRRKDEQIAYNINLNARNRTVSDIESMLDKKKEEIERLKGKIKQYLGDIQHLISENIRLREPDKQHEALSESHDNLVKLRDRQSAEISDLRSRLARAKVEATTLAGTLGLKIEE